MKNKVKNYAMALAELIMEAKPASQKKIADIFFKLIVKNNYAAKAGEIVALAQDIILKKKGNKKIILQTARKTDGKRVIEGFIKEGDVVESEINPEIIAGIKVIVNNEKQLDFSLQKKLNEIF